MSELLTIDSISVAYGNIQALHGVSMKIDEGDVVCLIGANGAGKSTLLKAIVGLEPLVGGSITLRERVIAFPHTGGEKVRFGFKKKHGILTTDKIAQMGIALVREGR
jgi:branched-chain amino acid transport system ATP-binding protein